ncbi:MarR family winged helix-turn-helix transcriptional regulator [Subtercola sp. YIM 133946]|uniref:MarR family winged helix-turn-helix transcriptional regulator n=1 Tax=Subtercola sp. YIM 133946 TaxID=3118909 RepID=UPI002F953955
MDEREVLIDRLAVLGENESTQTALFHQMAAARYGLGITDMRALSILLREGPQSAGDLMARLHVTSGAVTGVIDRLQDAGVARRETDRRDRRRVLVSVDTVGLAERENVYLSIGAAFSELYREYTHDQLTFLVQHFERAIAITQAQAALLAP